MTCPKCEGRMALRKIANAAEDIAVVLAQVGLGPRPPPQTKQAAARGTVVFVDLDMLGYFPCLIEVDATFELDTQSPSMVSFQVPGLAIEGGNC
ncbi:MAG: hypothetical protein R6X02_32015 [Enhygromyxa sp.]